MFLLLCSNYFADLTKKLEMCLTLVSVLLEIDLGMPKLGCPKLVYQCRKQPVSIPGST